MICLLNLLFYLFVVLSRWCAFLLRIGFDDVFGDLLFLKCLFSLYMFVLMLPLIFSLRNLPL
jgi:hypothetical protein